MQMGAAGVSRCADISECLTLIKALSCGDILSNVGEVRVSCDKPISTSKGDEFAIASVPPSINDLPRKRRADRRAVRRRKVQARMKSIMSISEARRVPF